MGARVKGNYPDVEAAVFLLKQNIFIFHQSYFIKEEIIKELDLIAISFMQFHYMW